LAGKLEAWPLSRPAEAARALIANQRWPSALVVAQNELFWVNRTEYENVGSGRTLGELLSCKLPDCVEPKLRRSGFVLPELGFFEGNSPSSPGFVVNSRFIWWLDGPYGFSASLRRLPR
jgi:hypothetical protein